MLRLLQIRFDLRYISRRCPLSKSLCIKSCLFCNLAKLDTSNDLGQWHWTTLMTSKVDVPLFWLCRHDE